MTASEIQTGVFWDDGGAAGGAMRVFGPAELLAGFCRSDEQNPFPVWQDGHVSPCFNQLVLGALPHAGMAVFSACYLGMQRRDLLQTPPPCGWTLRRASALLAALLFAADAVLVSLLQRDDLYLDVLADGCAVLAWLVHFGAVTVLRRTVFGRTRGPPLLLLLVLLSVPNLVVTLMIYCDDQEYLNLAEPLEFARFVLASARTLPLLVYLLAFAFPCIGDAGYTLYVNAADGSPLLPESPRPDTGEMVAEDGSGCVSRLFYLWLTPLLRRGQRGELDRPADVYHLPRKLRTTVVCRYFHQCWEACRRGAAVGSGRDQWPRPVSRNLLSGTWSSHYREEPLQLQGDVGLLRVLHKAFGLRYYALGVLKVAVNMLSFAGPLLLSSLVNFMEDEGAPVSWGAWCALGLFATTLLSSFLQNIFVFEVSKVALSARAALVSAVYGKALQVSGCSLAGTALGEVVNLMSTDTDRVVNFFSSFHELWSLPLQFAITLYLLYLQVGVAFLGGLCVALLLVPFNKFIASRILSNNQHMLRHKDSRVRLMTEILFGIRVIKFYAWEPHFTQKVADCRARELSHLKALKYLDAMCVYTWAALPVVISILTFVTYVLLGHQLTAAKVFTTLALVGMLIVPLNSFPWVLNGILEAKVSLERIQRFFKLSNQDLLAYYALVSPEDSRTSILLSQGTFSWQGPDGDRGSEAGAAEGSLLLHGLTLHVTKGSLVAVVGKVGCGKSSLLAALTGELNRLSGVVYVADREAGFGLASQEPWIQHASVRDNILFGKDYDPAFYQAVVDACALSDDLNVLPNGDRTEVGENGVTLSGGQKARLALARAVYMDKDIYLLDDPLAAVDADVAEHLMKKCVMELLGGKTRILCTHRVEFVDKADVVVLMENGAIIKTGTPAEILPLVEVVPKKRKNDHNMREKDGVQQEEQQEEEEEPGFSSDLCAGDDPDPSGAEQKQAGGLAWRVYQTYWAAVGGVLAASILMSLLLMQASKNVSDWWLSHWISELKNNGSTGTNGSASCAFSSPHLLLFSPGGLMSPLSSLHTLPSGNVSSDVRFYLTVYGSVAAANTIFTALRAFLFAYGAICAATAIHDRLLDRVLKATVSFFDTTPMGRILNRFSSDLYTVDDSLPFILNILLANVFGLLGTLVVISYGLPWVLALLLPLALVYHGTQRFYRHTSRELKRLCSITLSPVYSHFSETLTGLGTIRASGSSARFEEELARRLEQNQRCLFLSNAATQWLSIRLQLIGVAVVTGLGVLAVVQHQYDSVDPGLVGLSLSYALSITLLLCGLIFSFTQTEMQLVSVERTEEYSTGLPTEPQHQNTQLPPAWPEQGCLELRGAVLAYRDGLPNALDGVSLAVRAGEKVGVVGRTGSGKSTLFLALFRMVELNQGQILLDGLDIGTVALAQLRSRLAIIPQDPFLFSGTVRENLDPCGRHSDQQLLDVVDQCHLGSVVSRMGGLDAEVGERGRSFSVGQRQLLCLARALLTRAKVLCIDEATASVDQKTDKLLQQTIRETFQRQTVLTIAHRINTIMDCDRVLVMHAGKVVEFDTPAALTQTDRSVFLRLVGRRGEERRGGERRGEERRGEERRGERDG
ncbi:LOW QUALITY PROTEIN: ATP-binding cassette sub-family C member 10 [Cebidichthys violaceus]|uniref:LOW QUALITY PROTEIN: ATP-binding cassette sub-family C member 10 n=1 Tax=Cebidichthys violaceus TaxID=271503 RepID=UPI0035CC8D67